MLKRLHAVGMNLVFFDQAFTMDVADVVCLDNRHAVISLYEHICQTYQGEIIYIGFEGLALPSAISREQAFLEVSKGAGRVFNIPWRQNTEQETADLLDRLQEEGRLPAGIICNSGGIGLAAAKYMRERGKEGLPLATIDFMPEMLEYPMTAVEQPMRQLAVKAYQRLAAQNNQGESWLASQFLLKGKLRVCGK